MRSYTADEVNASIRRAIGQFQRAAPRLGGPSFASAVSRVIAGSQGFGDGEDFGPVVNVTPPIDLFSLPSMSISSPADLSYNAPGYPPVTETFAPASAATVPFSLTNTLNNLVSEIDAGSTALVRGTANYYAALTQIQNIQGAAKAGVPVDAYVAGKAATNTATFSLASLFGGGGGIVPMLVVGGLAIYLLSGERRSGGRR